MTITQLYKNVKWFTQYRMLRAIVLNELEKEFQKQKTASLENFTRKFLNDVVKCRYCNKWFLRLHIREKRCDECGGRYGSTTARRAAKRKDRAKHSLCSLP